MFLVTEHLSKKTLRLGLPVSLDFGPELVLFENKELILTDRPVLLVRVCLDADLTNVRCARLYVGPMNNNDVRRSNFDSIALSIHLKYEHSSYPGSPAIPTPKAYQERA